MSCKEPLQRWLCEVGGSGYPRRLIPGLFSEGTGWVSPEDGERAAGWHCQRGGLQPLMRSGPRRSHARALPAHPAPSRSRTPLFSGGTCTGTEMAMETRCTPAAPSSPVTSGVRDSLHTARWPWGSLVPWHRSPRGAKSLPESTGPPGLSAWGCNYGQEARMQANKDSGSRITPCTLIVPAVPGAPSRT